jgi:hypothetical protein
MNDSNILNVSSITFHEHQSKMIEKKSLKSMSTPNTSNITADIINS